MLHLICPEGDKDYAGQCEFDAIMRGERVSDLRTENVVVCVDHGITPLMLRRIKELAPRKIWMRSLGLGLFFSDFLGGPADDVAMNTEEMMPIEEAR